MSNSSPSACLITISSRNVAVKHSLASIWDHYNHLHDYPVYVHYFDDIYDDEEVQQQIVGDTGQKVIFKSVPYKTPAHIPKEELFYNQNLWYAKTRFPINRKGYLHMCNFTCNMYGYENTELHKYDYIMTHDDDAGFVRPISFDPVAVMEQRPEMLGAFSLRQALKNGIPHQGHRDTMHTMWEFTKGYIQKHNITPPDKALESLLTDPEANEHFFYLEWPDTYVIKSAMFETSTWKTFIGAVNEYGGNYKYRWGDCAIFGIYHRIHHGAPYGFEEEGSPVTTGAYNQGLFRAMQDWAPSIKDIDR